MNIEFKDFILDGFNLKDFPNSTTVAAVETLHKMLDAKLALLDTISDEKWKYKTDTYNNMNKHSYEYILQGKTDTLYTYTKLLEQTKSWDAPEGFENLKIERMAYCENTITDIKSYVDNLKWVDVSVDEYKQKVVTELNTKLENCNSDILRLTEEYNNITNRMSILEKSLCI